MRHQLLPFALGILAAAASAQVPTHIKVEIDYMKDMATGHSHRPSQAAMDAVVDMFACRGITLELDIDQAVPHIPLLTCATTPVYPTTMFDCSGTSSFSAYASLFRTHGAGWHYCLFIHRFDAGDGPDCSGAADLPGNDLVVAAGIFENGVASPWEEAATFAHELGHNLGLHHYSPTTPVLGRGPYPPNLASVMSYQYQLRGIKSQMECFGLVGSDHLFKELDYSDGRLPPLTELFLDEQVGVGIRPVDWDCSGAIESNPKTKDLDDMDPNWCTSAGGIGTVYDFDEWSAIVDDPDGLLTANGSKPQRVVTCATLVELLGNAEAPSDCHPPYPWPEPPGVSEPCVAGRMIWVDSANLGSQIGNGEFPYAFLDWAALFAPANSILYLQPGTHGSSTGSPILLDKPLILTGPGGAVVAP